MTIKLYRKSIVIQLQQILWTFCVFLSSLNNTFFDVLVIIFSNKNYFCFNYRNPFFIHAMNYFSVVLRIIFLMCIKNFFLIEPRIVFHGIANLFLGLQCIAGLAFDVDWFESLTSLGDHFENFPGGEVLLKRMPRWNIVRERNERGYHLSYKFKLKTHAAFTLNILFETFPVHVALHFIN